MENKVLVPIIVVLFLSLFGVVGYLIWQNNQLQKTVLQGQPPTITEVEPTSEPAEQPADTDTPSIPPSPTVNPFPDWLTYTSQEYNFQFSHPPEFEALDDENNLYGWPNGVVLLHQGGQAYDIPVEVWDTQAEYQQKYATRMSEITVKQAGGKYITFLNNTGVDSFDEITSTFTEIQP